MGLHIIPIYTNKAGDRDALLPLTIKRGKLKNEQHSVALETLIIYAFIRVLLVLITSVSPGAKRGQRSTPQVHSCRRLATGMGEKTSGSSESSSSAWDAGGSAAAAAGGWGWRGEGAPRLWADARSCRTVLREEREDKGGGWMQSDFAVSVFQQAARASGKYK